MTSIGETLRRERLRRNLDLGAISNELKISSRFLEAIENDQFEKLPAGMFAKSFVRQYARKLGLNEDELATELQKIIEPPPAIETADGQRPPATLIPVARMGEWESVGDGRPWSWSSSLPALALVVVVMLVCSGVYALWQRSRHVVAANEEAAQTAQSQPPAVQEPTTQPPVQASQPEAKSAETSPPPTPASETPASQDPSGDPRPQPSSADRPAGTLPPSTTPASPAADPAAAARKVLGTPGGAVKVEVTASELVWIAARADGKMTFSGTLETNQTRTIEAKDSVALRLGNAGGVNIVLNGKPIGPVGAKGQVKKVQLTSGGFQIVAAPAPAPKLLDPLDRL